MAEVTRYALHRNDGGITKWWTSMKNERPSWSRNRMDAHTYATLDMAWKSARTLQKAWPSVKVRTFAFSIEQGILEFPLG